MTDMATLRAEAARMRSAAGGAQRKALPNGEAQRGAPDQPPFTIPAEFRAEKVDRDGQEFYLVEGYASMTEKSYEMWDFFGPYEEVVTKTAFEKTLAADPMVVYRFNHGGTSMANTRNGRLELWSDSIGLGDRAWINPKRDDVQLLMHAIEDQDVSEQSFMFMITEGSWNDDFTEFRIDEVDLDRGDVGPVTFGANPHTLVAARSGEFLSAIPDMPVLVAREAMSRLALRSDIAPLTAAPAPVADDSAGRQSLALALAQLEVDQHHRS